MKVGLHRRSATQDLQQVLISAEPKMWSNLGKRPAAQVDVSPVASITVKRPNSLTFEGLVSSLSDAGQSQVNTSKAEIPQPLLSPNVRRELLADCEATEAQGENDMHKFAKLSWPDDHHDL